MSPEEHQRERQALLRMLVFNLCRNYRKRTQRIVDTEIETTVHNDSDNRGYEASVEASNAVRGKCLFIDINQAVELASSSTLRRLGVIRKTCTGVVKRVNEKQR